VTAIPTPDGLASPGSARWGYPGFVAAGARRLPVRGAGCLGDPGLSRGAHL